MLHLHCSRTSFFLIGFNVRKHLHAGNSLIIAKGLKLKLYDSLHGAACLTRWNCDLVVMECLLQSSPSPPSPHNPTSNAHPHPHFKDKHICLNCVLCVLQYFCTVYLHAVSICGKQATPTVISKKRWYHSKTFLDFGVTGKISAPQHRLTCSMSFSCTAYDMLYLSSIREQQ